ncbi:DUF4253 domain-containing protein [Luteococcus peritonei]|uniref:DUF4253 domain-containing protein n=1 Tax=Luteococcus peritonei TaxID=88874 RepID=A0ABW4RVH0_9ACTN
MSLDAFGQPSGQQSPDDFFTSAGGGSEIEVPVVPRATRAGRSEDLEALGLPAGSWVTSRANPQAGRFAWLSDEPMPLRRWWPRLVSAFPQTGWWPMIVPVENEMLAMVREGELDGPQPVEGSYAELLDELREAAREEWAADAPADQAWKYHAAPPAVGIHRGEVMTTQYPVQEHLLLVPVQRPADALAAIGWPGCEESGLSVAEFTLALRSLEERFGAVVGEMGPSSLMIDVTTPPTDVAQQTDLLREFNALCPDAYVEGELEDFLDSVGYGPWMFWWE